MAQLTHIYNILPRFSRAPTQLDNLWALLTALPGPTQRALPGPTQRALPGPTPGPYPGPYLGPYLGPTFVGPTGPETPPHWLNLADTCRLIT